MNNNKIEITKNLSDNIAYYRKKMSLTQLELATKLNYSDKSISKWERGEGVPDIFVITELSKFFGVNVDSLLSKRKRRFELFKYRYILAYFYASIVWLIAGITFGVISIMGLDYPAWHVLVYGIPVSTLVLFCFFISWRHIKWTYIYFTCMIWTTALSITLLMDDLTNFWVYIITVPIYLFVSFLLYVIYKPKKIK